jgi:hypothetical protein
MTAKGQLRERVERLTEDEASTSRMAGIATPIAGARVPAQATR